MPSSLAAILGRRYSVIELSRPNERCVRRLASNPAFAEKLRPPSHQKQSGRSAQGQLIRLGFVSLHSSTSTELVHTASGVDVLLLTRKIRMAFAANLDLDFRLGSPSAELVAASAVHSAGLVIRVDPSFHGKQVFGLAAHSAAKEGGEM